MVAAAWRATSHPSSPAATYINATRRCPQRTPSWSLGLTGSLPVWRKECPQLDGQIVGNFKGGEVTPMGQFHPSLDIEEPGSEFPRRGNDILFKTGEARWNCDVALFGDVRAVRLLVVEACGRSSSLRDPVNHDVREQFILGKNALKLPVDVAPVVELLDNPGQETYRRVIKAVTERLWLGVLDRGECAFLLPPGFHRGEIRLLFG